MSGAWDEKLVIAEIGSVHDGSFELACDLVDAAIASGADAVKFQTHIADAESLPDAPSPAYFTAEPRMAYFRRTAFSHDEWRRLKEYAEQSGSLFLSSPFCEEAVDLLEDLQVSAYKVPSGEVTNLPLLERLALTGKPVFLSSGMSNWSELDQAVGILQDDVRLTVMQCVSMYPCPPEKSGLNVLSEMKDRYQLRLGYSDHVPGIGVAIAAAALGADVIEKHFTLSKEMYGSDASNATEPMEFTAMARGVRDAWAAREIRDKDDLADFQEMKTIFEKSIVTAREIPEGTLLDINDLAYKKPGDGISAARYQEIIGRVAVRDLPANHKLSEEDIS